MARPDFRSQAAARLAAERTELSPAIIDLLRGDNEAEGGDIRRIPVGHIDTNPDQPRQHFDEEALAELAASIIEHGVLQPVLVRPRANGRFQLVAGERRWRASRLAGLDDLPAIVSDLDDEQAMEIAIIENLQREDISPLDEADIFARMTSRHGYSLRRLAQKLGKDKGYIENRLRLADAPAEIRELVSVRRDTLSAAYELMKVDDPRKRRRLATQVANGELSLVKLRERIEGRPPRQTLVDVATAIEDVAAGPDAPELVTIPVEPDLPVEDVDIDEATRHLTSAVEELTRALVSDATLTGSSPSDRQQFAKYLTLAKIKLENAIAVVRAGERHHVRTAPDTEEATTRPLGERS